MPVLDKVTYWYTKKYGAHLYYRFPPFRVDCLCSGKPLTAHPGSLVRTIRRWLLYRQLNQHTPRFQDGGA